MTQQVINLGVVADDGKGDKLRPAFTKVNANFTELYTAGLAARTQRAVTTSPIVVQATDQIINCRINTAATCTLPLASTRNGLPLTIKDLGFAGTNNIVITAAGSDTIDGTATTYTLHVNFAWVTLVPFADGLNVGWMVQ